MKSCDDDNDDDDDDDVDGGFGADTTMWTGGVDDITNKEL
jgi:hypothetical protein